MIIQTVRRPCVHFQIYVFKRQALQINLIPATASCDRVMAIEGDVRVRVP